VTKPVKRKSTKASDVMPAKCSKVATFSQNDISGLKDKMGISAMADSITTLSNMMKGFINKSENVSSKKPRSETISQANKKVVNNTPSRPLLPLEPNLVDTDVMNEFDLEPYMDDSMPQSSDADASPAHVDLETSFNPTAGFSEVFGDRSSEPAICQSGDLSNSEFIWDIPQLQAEEKTSAKIPEGLAYAVNAAISVKSSYDNMKIIEDKFFCPENCDKLCVPKVNKEIWSALPRPAHTQDSKMQEVQKYFVKGLIPIVKLANQCCKNEPLDIANTRSLLSDAMSLLGNGLLSLSHRRCSILRPYFNDKFKPICNYDVPVDSLLFGNDGMKALKELGDYTKIPIANPRFRNRISRFPGQFNNSFGRGYLNSKGPVGRQGSSYKTPVRGRGRGYPGGNRGSQRGQYQGYQSQY
jgi:hypothetical protein